MTKPYAEVIGDPIAQSKSPAIHNFWLAKLGIEAEYRACHVKPDELEGYFAQRRQDANWRGCNITIPHKETALGFADSVDESAASIGASNCIVSENGKLVAYNFDRAGIDRAIPRVHSSVCIIGAGGAARAAIPTLDFFCAIDVRFVVRDRHKALKLCEEFNLEPKVYGFEEPSGAFRGAEGVVNASPLGMVGQPPMPKAILDALGLTARDAYVFDMVYNPLETELLKRARDEGLEAIDGLVMLIGQAGWAFARFFGSHPDPDRKFEAELRALLTA